MNRVLSLVMLGCLIILLSLSGCEGNTGMSTSLSQPSTAKQTVPSATDIDRAPLVFGIIYPTVNPTYEIITENLKTASVDHAVKLIVQAPDEANLEQQIRIMEMMIKQGVDGIAIDPVDSAALVEVIDKAVAKDIPVICFESDAPASKRLAFIGADNVQTGITIGRSVSKLLDGKGMVIVESGMPHMLGLSQRLEGLKQYLSSHTSIDMLEVRNNDGTEEDATQQLEAMISAHPHFSALINLDPVSSSSSILVWKAKGLKQYNIALGLTPTVQESLINGQITRIISQNEQHWGESIMNTLLAITDGQRVPPFINTGIIEIGE